MKCHFYAKIILNNQIIVAGKFLWIKDSLYFELTGLNYSKGPIVWAGAWICTELTDTLNLLILN